MSTNLSRRKYLAKRFFQGTIVPNPGTNVALYACPADRYAKCVLTVVDSDDNRLNSYHVIRFGIKNNLIWSGNRGLVPGEFETREAFLGPGEEIRFIREQPPGSTSTNQQNTQYTLSVYEFRIDI